MSSEIPPLTPENLDLKFKTLSPHTKMGMILEIFDLGQGSTEKKEERKRKFIELIGTYNQAIIKARPSESLKSTTSSDEHKKEIHNQIMSVIRSISLSQGIDKEKRELAEYLVHHREEVERMVTTYFTGHDTSPDPETYSPIRQAQESPLYFSKPGEEE